MKTYNDIEKIMSDCAKNASDTVKFRSVINTSKVFLYEKEPKNTAVIRAVLNVAAIVLVAVLIGGAAFATSYIKNLSPESSGTVADDTGEVTDTKENEYTPLPAKHSYTFDGIHEIEFRYYEFYETDDILPLSEPYENPRKLQNEASADFGYNVYIYDRPMNLTWSAQLKRTWLCLTDTDGNLVLEIKPTNNWLYNSGCLIYAEKTPSGSPVAVLSVNYGDTGSSGSSGRSVFMYDTKTNKAEIVRDVSSIPAAAFTANELFSDSYKLKANKEEGRIELIRSAVRYIDGNNINEHLKKAEEIQEQDPDKSYAQAVKEYMNEYYTKDGCLNDKVYGVKYFVYDGVSYGFADIEAQKALPSGTDKVLYRAPEFTKNRKFIKVISNNESYYPDAMGHRTGLRGDGSLEELTYCITCDDLYIKYGEDFDVLNNVYGKDYNIIKISVYNRTEINRTLYYLENRALREFYTEKDLSAYLKNAEGGDYTVIFRVSWDDGELENLGDTSYSVSYFMHIVK
jgi:hypothetical protein